MVCYSAAAANACGMLATSTRIAAKANTSDYGYLHAAAIVKFGNQRAALHLAEKRAMLATATDAAAAAAAQHASTTPQHSTAWRRPTSP
jgi:hypothetical protein